MVAFNYHTVCTSRMVVLLVLHHPTVDADGEHCAGGRPAKREAEHLGVGAPRRGDLGEVDGERAEAPVGVRVQERRPHGEVTQRGAAGGEVVHEHVVERGGAPRHPRRRRVLPLAALAPPPHHHAVPLRVRRQAGDALHLQTHHAPRSPREEAAQGPQQPALPLAQNSAGALASRRAPGGHVQEVEFLRRRPK
jgi:hypothetical protein